MELYATDTQFILVNGNDSLFIDRYSGGHEAKTGAGNQSELDSAQCLGKVYGYIGKLRISPVSETRLVFIRQHTRIGRIKGLSVYKIGSVVSIPLESECELVLESCPKSLINENCQLAPPHDIPPSGQLGSQPATTPILDAQSPSHHQVIPTILDEVPAGLRQMVKVKSPQIRSYAGKKIENSNQVKLERRMLDEFHKMFTEADSFYYSKQFDITNSIQRQQSMCESQETSSDDVITKRKNGGALWENADQRFFWNWYMVESLVNAKDKKLYPWILPIIQGFIQCETCVIEQAFDRVGVPDLPVRGSVDLWLISRRSRFQAGTRYLRRGIDEQGKVANYVETEQILLFKSHLISFVQIRGSIPVFWSQSNRYRYRPPPKIERDEEETYKAFKKHFDEELSTYNQMIIVNLVEKGGKEKVLGDSFLQNILRLNSGDLTYVTFDFHDSCRGMKFEKVSLLIEKLGDIIKSMNYTWVDSYGSVLKQAGTFRVNCVDCLDRTNVVQTHLAKEMLTMQLSKLGLIIPEVGLTLNVRKVLQTMWANNGDTISKQYAGTNALKGDFTRTGERKITGVMKDGMNSANRYYLNRFKDASRQAAIDLMLGVRNTVTEDELEEKQPFEKEATPDQIKSVIEDVKKSVIPPDEVVLGTWGLVNGMSESDSIEIDTIFILTERSFYITDYDCGEETLTEDTQIVNLSLVDSVELGFDTLNLTQPTTFWNIFTSGSSSNNVTLVPNMQINYIQEGKIASHEFRSSNMRFFNNVPIPIQQPEEMHEALRMIAEAIKIASTAQGHEIQVIQTNPPTKDAGVGSNKPRIPGMASSFVNKYFSNPSQVAPADAAVLAKKISAASLERFTPKYFRRGSNTGAVGNYSVGGGVPLAGGSIISEPVVKSACITPQQDSHGSPATTNLHLKVVPTSDSPDLIDLNARTPISGHLYHNYGLTNDLVLSSCGILSPGGCRPVIPYLIDNSSSELLVLDGDGHGISPITPISDSISQEEAFKSPSHLPKVSMNSNPLTRHRYSLPANSLAVIPPSDYPMRCKTPEITITEENLPLFSGGGGGVKMGEMSPLPLIIPGKSSTLSIAMRRISRSSDDINRVCPGVGISQIGHTGGFKIPNLFPMGKSDNRASSQQNIFDQSSTMRGSHSDNALRENPFQTQNGQNQKRGDVVFAPLGKLGNFAFRGMQNIGANYLDPRKIRDSFKPGRQTDTAEDREMEEKKSECQTVFIDA